MRCLAKITVWKCPTHGEMELMEDLAEAYCPKCGAKMEKVGGYEE